MVDVVDLNAIKAQRQELEKLAKERNGPETDVDDDWLLKQKEYANRTIAEEAMPDLKEMNTRYAFVHDYGGKPAIKSLVYSPLHTKKVVSFMAVESIYTIYMNRIAKVTKMAKNGGIPLGKWWMAQEHRKEYVAVTFEPNKEPGEYDVIDEYKLKRAKAGETKLDIHVTYFNAWEGLAIEPLKGSWKKMRKHIYVVLCNKDKKKFKYVIKWLAWTVQNPGERAEVAIIFKGKKGVGKGIILQAMVDIFGAHGMTISNREHLTGKHNQHLATCSFLYADEAYYPGDKEVEGILKNLITEKTIATEPKFKEVQINRNCLHIAMATNADWIIPASEDERRYFINETDNKYAKGHLLDDVRQKYFNDLWTERLGPKDENGKHTNVGTAAMLYDLLRINTKGFHPRNNIPETEELRKQITMSLSKLKYAILSMLEDGIFPGARNTKGEYAITSSNMLEHIHNQDPGNKTITNKAVIALLKELNVELYRTKVDRWYIFPELGLIRQIWSDKVMKNTEWRTNEEWQTNKGF